MRGAAVAFVILGACSKPAPHAPVDAAAPAVAVAPARAVAPPDAPPRPAPIVAAGRSEPQHLGGRLHHGVSRGRVVGVEVCLHRLAGRAIRCRDAGRARAVRRCERLAAAREHRIDEHGILIDRAAVDEHVRPARLHRREHVERARPRVDAGDRHSRQRALLARDEQVAQLASGRIGAVDDDVGPRLAVDADARRIRRRCRRRARGSRGASAGRCEHDQDPHGARR
jgi:hypothetical protein